MKRSNSKTPISSMFCFIKNDVNWLKIMFKLKYIQVQYNAKKVAKYFPLWSQNGSLENTKMMRDGYSSYHPDIVSL